jgi:hypothetical protein
MSATGKSRKWNHKCYNVVGAATCGCDIWVLSIDLERRELKPQFS